MPTEDRMVTVLPTEDRMVTVLPTEGWMAGSGVILARPEGRVWRDLVELSIVVRLTPHFCVASLTLMVYCLLWSGGHVHTKLATLKAYLYHSVTKPESVHRVDLTYCINQMISERQSPHKIVNLLLPITNLKNKSTIFGGVDFLESSE